MKAILTVATASLSFTAALVGAIAYLTAPLSQASPEAIANATKGSTARAAAQIKFERAELTTLAREVVRSRGFQPAR